ncbi:MULTISPECIES: heme-binding protein [unclassified Streptomyces]|uniref:heme-binding protein n=1 Tax=unclassified Streptomyces TaxID=2593676 RepID=UPI0006AF39B0|nr:MULTISPECIES: heme-binding protein [unclassified Streptomyces]
MRTTRTVGLAGARRTIGAGIAEATRTSSPGGIVVADAGGNLLAHVRMDGAQLGGVEHCVDKARAVVPCRPAGGGSREQDTAVAEAAATAL